MRAKKSNEEVLVAMDNVITLESPYIEFLKKGAARTRRKRIRLCTHKRVSTVLQEMFIVHTKDTYVRPHKHLHKTESLHIIEGRADVFLFDEHGAVTKVIRMGDYESGHVFYYRMEAPLYHTMVIRSDYLVFHEVTVGPFRKSGTVVAPWSPEERDSLRVKHFLDTLKNEKN